MALFGTDGIRGRYGQFLTEELAERVAYAAGILIPPGSRVIVGRDTRDSGVILEAGIVTGFTKSGHDVVRLGVIPTPGLAFLTLEANVALGVMITASHNPASDNGIKIFGHDGMKIADSIEVQIEEWVLSGAPLPEIATGKASDDLEAVERYARHLTNAIDTSLNGMTIALDCAHGAASAVAPRILKELGAKVVAIGDAPDGANINDGVGSTHLGPLRDLVKSSGAVIGIAHDGDADRALMIDHLGRLIDGDHILATLAIAMSKSGALAKNTVVTTVMSNLGFHKKMAELGINIEVTAVGDRFVLERINERELALGGEQSGHIIVRNLATTGDGILTALLMLALIANHEVDPAKIADVFEQFPQVLVNVSVTDKAGALVDPVILTAIEEANAQLGERGRLLVRASGTEELVRVMAEADSMEYAELVVESLASLIRSRFGA